MGWRNEMVCIAVGMLMVGSMRKIEFDDLTEALPAFACIALMVFTYNIANGLAAGLILHPALKLACGRWREVHPGGALLGVLCLSYYIVGAVH